MVAGEQGGRFTGDEGKSHVFLKERAKGGIQKHEKITETNKQETRILVGK